MNQRIASNRSVSPRSFGLAILVLGALVVGCAQNPVTGQQDFVLMTEDQEIALGRQEHPKVLKQYGVVDELPALQAYVQEVGERLATKSHRSNLVYRFTVLDSSEVNAFALPGGYIYITRGLLAYLNSEAELAAVLGHEIGHVTARHSVRQISAAQATGILAAVIGAQIGQQGTQDLLNLLGNALLSGYGREHELEADRLGAEYLARAGYDPQAMIRVIGVLKDQEEFEKQQAADEGRRPNVYHGVFATHPDNDRRLQEVVGAAAQFQAPAVRPDNRDEYLHHLEGLAFGDSKREGVRRNAHFYHAELGFALNFPAGWRVDNYPDRLSAKPPSNDALLQIWTEDLNRRVSPEQFMRDRLGLRNLHNGESFTHQEMPGYTAITEADTPWGRREARFTVIYFDNRAYIFAGAAKDPDAPYRYDQAFVDTARSFHRLTDEERQLAQPQILHLIQAGTDTRLEDLARHSPIPNHPLEQLRLLNGLYPQGEPGPGQLIKIVE